MGAGSSVPTEPTAADRSSSTAKAPPSSAGPLLHSKGLDELSLSFNSRADHDKIDIHSKPGSRTCKDCFLSFAGIVDCHPGTTVLRETGSGTATASCPENGYCFSGEIEH